MTGSAALRRFLGWASIAMVAVLVGLFIAAVVDRSSILAAVAGGWILVVAAFYWPWAALSINHQQREAVGTAVGLLTAATPDSPSTVSLPLRSSGLDLVRRHRRAAFVIVVLIVGGAVVGVLDVLGYVPDAASQLVLQGAVVVIMVGIFWGAFFRWFYQRPLDASTLIAGRADVRAWSQYVTTGLKAYIQEARPEVGAIERNGYVLMTPQGLEFWQRGAKTLDRLFSIPRAIVDDVSVGTVTDQLQQQQGVYLALKVTGSPDASVPVLIKGIFGGLRGEVQAPRNFIAAWNGVSAQG